MKRRKFIRNTTLGSLGLTAFSSLSLFSNPLKPITMNFNPITIATWNFPNASKKAGEMLAAGATALDAVEQGVMVEEADIKNTTVGKGGAPDREGNVTLDACIMNPQGDAGAVVYLKNNMCMRFLSPAR